MAANPVIFALANPNPEILPEDVKAGAQRRDHRHRPHRLPQPGQQRPVLSLHLPRRARCGQHDHHEEMEIAAVHAIAELAQAEQSEVVAAAYVGEKLAFGPEYLIPKPFDPRLMIKIAPAVAKAAADSGVAQRPITDLEAYVPAAAKLRLRLGHHHEADFCLPPSVHTRKRVAYAEGEEERVLRACQIVVDEGLARPTLIGRPAVIASAHREIRPAPEGGAGLRHRQRRARRAATATSGKPTTA
jgi:malate dehydrogenase (oxaloacetate-decarboxylating)(NADP+)